MPLQIIGLVGNLAAAEVVAELGTSRVLELANLIKHVESILK